MGRPGLPGWRARAHRFPRSRRKHFLYAWSLTLGGDQEVIARQSGKGASEAARVGIIVTQAGKAVLQVGSSVAYLAKKPIGLTQVTLHFSSAFI